MSYVNNCLCILHLGKYFGKISFTFTSSFLDFADLYTRVWDVADYVVPPAENGAFFVATNVIITANQTRGTSNTLCT